MSKNVKITWNADIEDILKKAAKEHLEKNGIDITCPNCSRPIHLSFSGDTCQFCGFTINYSIDPEI